MEVIARDSLVMLEKVMKHQVQALMNQMHQLMESDYPEMLCSVEEVKWLVIWPEIHIQESLIELWQRRELEIGRGMIPYPVFWQLRYLARMRP